MQIKFPSSFIKLMIQNFNNEGVRYLIFKNFEELPDGNASKDVDIFILPEDLALAKKIVEKTAHEQNFQLIKKMDWDYISWYTYFKSDDSGVTAIKLDLMNLTWRGLPMVDKKLILEKREKHNDIFVPCSGHQSFMMILYYSLYANRIWEKYHKVILSKFDSDRENFIELGVAAIGKELTDKLVNLLSAGKVSELISLRSEIAKSLMSRHFKLANSWKHWSSELGRYFTKGKFIVFLGPDGAGKSTIVDLIHDLMFKFGLTGNPVGHFLPENVPPPHKLFFAPKTLKTQDYEKPYSAKPAGMVSSIFRLGYYFLAFLLGHYFSIHRKLKRVNTIFYDRYYHDLIVDPSRNRISISRKGLYNLFRFLPKPDLVLVILAKPETIMSRKDELKEEKIKELLAQYKLLGEKYKKVVYVNNDGQLQDGFANCLREISTVMK